MANRALSAALAGDVSEAVRTLDRLARGPVAAPRATQNLALAYALSGDPERAGRILSSALSEPDAAKTLAFYRTLGAAAMARPNQP
jgi:Flp pilus assembly protein TadD